MAFRARTREAYPNRGFQALAAGWAHAREPDSEIASAGRFEVSMPPSSVQSHDYPDLGDRRRFDASLGGKSDKEVTNQ